MNKYLLYAGIIAALVFAECRALQIWRAKGYAEAKSRYEQQALEAENARIAAVRQTEQKAAQDYAARLQTIEQEKQDAQNANLALRRELDRLQQRIAAKTNQGGSVKNLPQTARPSADANAAQGWVLLGECSKHYAAMAEIADTQRDDLARWQAWGDVVDGIQPEMR